MTSPFSSIRNLGLAYEESCAKIGINSAEKLREVGTDETYRRLLQAGTKPHFIGYYVLVMALQGRPWNDCKGDEKKKLRLVFDSIEAEAIDEGHGAFEQMMDQIGVRAPSP
jgi:DNA transformation protein